MNQLCKVREFKQQEGQTSFPILLVDGTGSMYAEYEHVVDAWRQTFSPFGLNKLEFQWENGLFPLDEPFRSAGWGDITKTFDQVFDILQTQKMPKNITIIFVSDGQEDFDIDQLTEKIKLVTDQYIISFISIAIGSQFPNDISNNLYLQLHNSHRNFAPMYERERNFDSSIEEMEEYFLATFEEIKRQLSFCSVAYECDKPVKLTIVSQPTTRVTSGALFLTDSEVRINGEVVEPTNSEEDKKAIIVSSVQQALINYGSNSNKETIVKDFNIIKEISEKIYKPEKIETDQTFQAVQDFVESVTCNEIEFKLLSSEKLTKIQSNLTNPEKLSQVVQTITVDDPNNLETPVILKSFKKKVGACYIKGRSSLKIKQGVVQNESQCVAQIIKDTNEVIKNTLQSYLNKLQKEKPQDCKKLLREFYDVIQSKLNEFDKLDPRQITEEILEESTTMNQILEILSKLDQEKQLSWNYAFDEIKKALNEGNISSSMAIVDKQDDYKHLPFFQQGKNDDDWESIIIVIFDRNDKMKEYDLAFNLFNETFQNIEEEKLIKLTWRNNTFTIIDSENQQCDKLMDILRKFENSHGLREKKIFITVVSDGQTDYKTLHKNFKSAKSSFCNIRFIYVAVGMNFKVALENDIAKKFHNRDVKGKPTIYTIPRQHFSQSVNKDKAFQPFQKAFEELKDKLFKEKEKAPQRLSQVFSSQIRKSVVGDQIKPNEQPSKVESNQHIQQSVEINQQYQTFQNEQQMNTLDHQSQEQTSQQNFQSQVCQKQNSQQTVQQQQVDSSNKQEEIDNLENAY